MIRTRLIGVVLGLLSIGFVVALRVPGSDTVNQVGAGKPMLTQGATLLVQLGLQDSQPTRWGGELQLSEGQVLSLRTIGRGQVTGSNSWRARSQAAKKKKRTEIRPVELHATVTAPLTATATIVLRQGRVSFALGDIPPEGKLFLDGQVRIHRGPLSIPLTDQTTDDDFPATAVGPDGTIWLAYVAYDQGNPITLPTDGSIPQDWSSMVTKGNGDQIKLVSFDGKQWSAPIDVTEPRLDVWRPTVMVRGGNVIVIWSQNVAGDWDLHARAYDPSTRNWPKDGRLRRQGADINPVAVARPDGQGSWVVWQGWADGSFDIFVKEIGTGRDVPPVAVASSPANEWNPAAAVDSQGTLYIAYDTYEKGDYDVHLSVGGRKKIKVADSPKFEARPSITVDKQDRVWIAYEEAGANWGKDFGTKWTGPSGVPFYLDRKIAVRVISHGKVLQPQGDVPAARIQTRYGGGRRVRTAIPRLGSDGAGRIWLLYRRHQLASGGGEFWGGFATYSTGNKWAPAIPLPNSANLLDNRPALAKVASGELVAIYSTDSRTGNTRTAGINNLQVGVLSAEKDAVEPALVPVSETSETVEPVHPNEAAEIQRMREFRVQAGGKTYQLLRGEFHRHTEMTSHRDQDGPFEEIWRYGLDVAKMDWLGPGDHDNGNQDHGYTWWLTQKQIEIYQHAPTFIPMFTHERSVRYPSGHRNVIFARRGIRPLPRLQPQQLLMGTPDVGAPDIKRLYAYLRYFDGICAMHTSATGMGTDWRDNDPDVEPVVEIYQGHRQNYEHKGAPQSAKDREDSIGGYQPAGYVWNALKRGYRLGFQVSSDHVSTHLSYAVVLAEETSRNAIVDAFKRRHCYGTQDNIVLVVKSGEHLMGDQFTISSAPEFEITAIGTAPIARVAIVRGVGNDVPTYVYNAAPNQAEVSLRWTDTSPAPGKTSYYYVRTEQADGKLAWASPMWITYEP